MQRTREREREGKRVFLRIYIDKIIIKFKNIIKSKSSAANKFFYTHIVSISLKKTKLLPVGSLLLPFETEISANSTKEKVHTITSDRYIIKYKLIYKKKNIYSTKLVPDRVFSPQRSQLKLPIRTKTTKFVRIRKRREFSPM